MYTYSAKPNTIEEVQTTIENWFGTRYKETKSPFSLKANQTGLDVFISHSAHHDLKVEILERCLLSKHGYQVAGYGFFNGVCWAAGQLPYELSCECIKTKIIPMLEGHIQTLTEFRKKLLVPATEAKGYHHISTRYFTTWAKVEVYATDGGHHFLRWPKYGDKANDMETVPVSRYTWLKEGAMLEETATNMNACYAEEVTREIKYTKSQLARQQKRVAEWPKPRCNCVSCI